MSQCRNAFQITACGSTPWFEKILFQSVVASIIQYEVCFLGAELMSPHFFCCGPKLNSCFGLFTLTGLFLAARKSTPVDLQLFPCKMAHTKSNDIYAWSCKCEHTNIRNFRHLAESGVANRSHFAVIVVAVVIAVVVVPDATPSPPTMTVAPPR